MSLPSTSPWVYVGTQRSGPGTGFSCARFDEARGELSAFRLVEPADDPAFFVVTADGRHLYTCNSGTPGGVSAYARDPVSGVLTRLGRYGSKGRGPSQLSLDRTGRFVLTANYGGGYVEVIAITPGGGLGAQTAVVQHEGHGVDPVRQTRPYPHCISTDPTNRFALVADLGLDRVLVYAFDARSGTLTSHTPSGMAVAPGAGPRHLAWHPNGRWVYLVEEIANRVTTLEWNRDTGQLRTLQTVPSLPPDFSGENTAAEILVHTSGRFLYVSNRGHDSVAAFAIDQADGILQPFGHTPTGGRTPRYMAFDPSHRWLLVVNVDSDHVAAFRVGEDGQLARTGSEAAVKAPYGIAITT
jgi:6-phosphogluconolactonase